MSGAIDQALKADLTDYERGWIEGVYEFAHMRDGVLYVGTMGRTLDQVIRHFLAARGKSLEEGP